MDRCTRRRLLQAGTAAGVGGLATTAGCLGFLGGDDQEETTDPDDSGSSDDGAATATTTVQQAAESYLRWLPAPAEFVDSDGYSFIYHGIAAFREHREQLAKTTYNEGTGIARSVEEAVGMDPRSIEGVIQTGMAGTKVVTGEFDAESIVSGLEERKFESRESYRDHELFLQLGQDKRAIAVGDSSVLVCRRSGPNEPVAVARMLVDTRRGEIDRYFDVNEDFRLAASGLQDATRAGVQTMEPREESEPARGRFVGNTAFGFGFTVGETTSNMRFTLVFEEVGQADPDQVRTWTNEGLDGLDQYRDYQVQKDGRLVSVTGTIPTEKFDFLRDGNPGRN